MNCDRAGRNGPTPLADRSCGAAQLLEFGTRTQPKAIAGVQQHSTWCDMDTKTPRERSGSSLSIPKALELPPTHVGGHEKRNKTKNPPSENQAANCVFVSQDSRPMSRRSRLVPCPAPRPPDGSMDSSRPCTSVILAQADMWNSGLLSRFRVIGELCNQGINQLQGLAPEGPPTPTYGSLPVSHFQPVRPLRSGPRD